MEVDDLASNCESVSKSKLSFEKTLRSCEDQLAEAQRRIEEQDRMIAELNTEKDRTFSRPSGSFKTEQGSADTELLCSFLKNIPKKARFLSENAELNRNIDERDSLSTQVRL